MPIIIVALIVGIWCARRILRESVWSGAVVGSTYVEAKS